ncbi:hypothetical protein NGM44_08415 [Moraxella sp. FZFQ2102]|uniref:hypothetical protein n=1 Tax=Moraxella sp. FZFQ2102 TaxID=2953752 RepID=UPI00209C619C|nr:hypothetical protein [Moraxella sp. FZFQ2102]USZ14386.1 hypothetical protein NGM44_08415 [Moraxella sp. FZFQ2102]
MNIYYVTYCLSRACLGEISENFSRIYWSFDKYKNITVYFYLISEIEEDVNIILEEILPMLEFYINEDLKMMGEYSLNHKIFYDDCYINCDDYYFCMEFFRKKEIVHRVQAMYS